MNLIDLVDYPQIRYESVSDSELVERGLNGRPLPFGQYATALVRDESVCLVRDPVGCNKLFFGFDGRGRLVTANRIVEVWRRGVPLPAIASCPPGHALVVSRDGIHDAGGSDVFRAPADPGVNISEFREESRATLERAFRWLAQEYTDCRFVVCLSGGLDSSVVASFAAAHLSSVTAACFTYLREDELRRHVHGAPLDEFRTVSDDFRCAARVASALRMPLLPVVRSREAVADAVGSSVQLCQDWRDFNVHCATVNLFLAQDIQAAFQGERVVVLTGDLMNEYVCDYREERVEDTVYYRVPRIPTAARRRFFVRGLDAGDREIGVFWAHGLVACQPFSLLAEQYMRIPERMLEQPDLKWTLNGPLLAAEVVAHVSKTKTRAQVGGMDMGTLGAYHALGIGEAQLRRAWHDQFPTESQAACDELIQFGRYRAPRYAESR